MISSHSAGSDRVMRFPYEDSFFNRASGSFRSTPDGYALSIDIIEVADPRCLMFYSQSLLQRTKQKNYGADYPTTPGDEGAVLYNT